MSSLCKVIQVKQMWNKYKVICKKNIKYIKKYQNLCYSAAVSSTCNCFFAFVLLHCLLIRSVCGINDEKGKKER